MVSDDKHERAARRLLVEAIQDGVDPVQRIAEVLRERDESAKVALGLMEAAVEHENDGAIALVRAELDRRQVGYVPIDDSVPLRCPGCNSPHPRPDFGEGSAPCCNPLCKATWGTGCYHCHHPSMR